MAVRCLAAGEALEVTDGVGGGRCFSGLAPRFDFLLFLGRVCIISCIHSTAMLRFLTYSVLKVSRVQVVEPLPAVACQHRRCLQTSNVFGTDESDQSENYFKVFSLETKFDVDTSELSSKFRSLQRQWHPDKYASKTETEQAMAAKESSVINRAYRTLKDPLRRSLHLLKLSGFPLEEGTMDVDPEFLMEIMEINEKLADISSHDKMSILKAENEAMLGHLRSSIATAFAAKDFEEARKMTARMKYYVNISAKVLQFERERGI
ncbi:iron-sulfur cluster co-chaperone protein HscB-like [Pollicipes pollicipes]|uniref:iron-sulfur cluster co-chaperone protein HscB-like n=1 Tax=Pollicipes pollicipes TaxID=41117 RepID=UPI0018851450|nr:iron-sulfur cluster co-chaperone protein HscB-like [Pollicipes pollicipes]